MAKNEKEIYEMLCKDKFRELMDMQLETLRILRGENSSPGLVDDVRQLKTRWTYIFGGMAILFTALISQFIKWLLEVL
jgi:hypothetical protein